MYLHKITQVHKKYKITQLHKKTPSIWPAPTFMVLRSETSVLTGFFWIGQRASWATSWRA